MCGRAMFTTVASMNVSAAPRTVAASTQRARASPHCSGAEGVAGGVTLRSSRADAPDGSRGSDSTMTWWSHSATASLRREMLADEHEALDDARRATCLE